MENPRNNTQARNATDREEQLSVYFDGACPVCSREIALYRRLHSETEIAWVDVTSEDFAAEDLTRTTALSRLHVRAADGRLVSGVPAFRELWSRFPALRWLSVVTRPRPLQWLMERAYDYFLRRRATASARRSHTQEQSR